jgi:hypothetical protein
MRAVVPDARSIRSHCLTSSSRLTQLFAANGLTHESNLLLPPTRGPDLMPWTDVHGLVQVPIRWEDDIRLLDASLGEPASWVGKLDLLTVDFHPIHLFLNSVDLADYEDARADFGDPARLLGRRRPAGSGGCRDRFQALMQKAAAIDCVRMSDLAAEKA